MLCLLYGKHDKNGSNIYITKVYADTKAHRKSNWLVFKIGLTSASINNNIIMTMQKINQTFAFSNVAKTLQQRDISLLGWQQQSHDNYQIGRQWCKGFRNMASWQQIHCFFGFKIQQHHRQRSRLSGKITLRNVFAILLVSYYINV